MTSTENIEIKEEIDMPESKGAPGLSIGKKIGALVALLVVFTFCITQLLASELHMYLDVADDINDSSMVGFLVGDLMDPDEMTLLYRRGLEIYQGIPEELRQQRLSKEYLSYYDELVTPAYREMADLLMKLRERHGYRWIDLRVEDPETGRIIYLLNTDPDEHVRYGLGYWEEADETVQVYEINSYGWVDYEENNTIERKNDYSLAENVFSSIHNVSVMMSLPKSWFVTEVPYYDRATGEIIGHIGFGEDVQPYHDHRRVFGIIYMICMVILLVVILAVISLVIRQIISKPISALSNAARNYVADKDKYQSGHYFENVRVTTNDEVRILRDSMSSMEKDIENYMNDLTAMIAEREHNAAEMDVGSRIQSSMLPEELTGYNGIRNFDISAYIHPAKEVGGDFYDFFAIDDDHIAIAIADVSGKGVPAALFMIIVKSLIMTAGQSGLSPAGIAGQINRKLCEKNSEAMFATVWLGIYCASEKRLRYINAGHEDHALYRAAEDRFEMIREEHDIALGVLTDYVYTEREAELKSGDKIYLYTDGIPEAMAKNDEMYGLKRLKECLNAHRSEQGSDLLNSVIGSVGEFTEGARQYDDMTSVLIEIL